MRHTVTSILMLMLITASVSAIGSVPESEIPSPLSQTQLTALEEVFDEIETLIAGSAQMSTEEFNTLNSSISSYSTEQKEVLYLLMEDTWYLIKGTAQMSEAELAELKIKYSQDNTNQEDNQDNETSNPPADDEPNDPDPEPDPVPQETSSPDPDFVPNSEDSAQPEEQTTTQQTETSDKIHLNPRAKESTDKFTTKEGKLRLFAIYTFTGLVILIVIYLIFKKL